MVDALILAARFVLAAVFAVAAFAKLTDREGTRLALAGFGVPEALVPALALLLPFAELVVAALVLPSTTALVGALGAVVLLVLFSAAIAANLVRGREPECHCFGQLHPAPIGPWTLVRNAGLVAVAAVAVAGSITGSGPSAVGWVWQLDGAEAAVLAGGAVAALIVTAGAMAFMSLLRAHGRVLMRLDRLEQLLAYAGLDVDDSAEVPAFGLEPGTPAPADALELLRPGLPLLLVFASPQCGPCRRLLPKLAGWQASHSDRLTVAVAADGAPDEVQADAEEFGLERVVVDEGGVLQVAFEANGTPSAVLIAPDGSVASRVASGVGPIAELAAQVIDAPGVPVGAPVPALELASLDGPPVKLGDFRGHDTLLLFWNPDCGFCRSMHGDLLAWEGTAKPGKPRLVVVSSGDEAKTRSEGFRSTVLLDERHAANGKFGAGGTPMAVLLGADGRVASDVAAGAQAVLALADSGHNAKTLAVIAP